MENWSTLDEASIRLGLSLRPPDDTEEGPDAAALFAQEEAVRAARVELEQVKGDLWHQECVVIMENMLRHEREHGSKPPPPLPLVPARSLDVMPPSTLTSCHLTSLMLAWVGASSVCAHPRYSERHCTGAGRSRQYALALAACSGPPSTVCL